MFNKIKEILKKDYIIFDKSKIPLKKFRFCGSEFKDDDYFVKSAENEARKILNDLIINKDYTILDIGCGYGRLPIGLKRINKNVNYLGIDVHEKAINWCTKHIREKNLPFMFSRINIQNDRYNSDGKKFNSNFKFNLKNEAIDYIYLYSVFSHMSEEHMIFYLNDFKRILKKNGKIYFTTFVEENVPDFEINPSNYLNQKIVGPLHVVRYNKNHLFDLLNNLGFNIINFSHKTEADNQSALTLNVK